MRPRGRTKRSGSSRGGEQSRSPRDHSRSDAANLGPAASHSRVYLPFSSFVIVMPAVADSAANCTLSPTFTCFSIAGSWTRNTIVMLSSSISRLLIGPLVIVIFPAPASIFLTTPLTIASSADASSDTKMESASVADASLLNFIFFPFVGFRFCGGLLDDDGSDHSGFPVIRNQAGIFEHADLGEPPHDLIRLLGSKPHSAGIVVLHVRILLHGLGVLGILRRSREDELVV